MCSIFSPTNLDTPLLDSQGHGIVWMMANSNSSVIVVFEDITRIIEGAYQKVQNLRSLVASDAQALMPDGVTMAYTALASATVFHYSLHSSCLINNNNCPGPSSYIIDFTDPLAIVQKSDNGYVRKLFRIVTNPSVPSVLFVQPTCKSPDTDKQWYASKAVGGNNFIDSDDTKFSTFKFDPISNRQVEEAYIMYTSGLSNGEVVFSYSAGLPNNRQRYEIDFSKMIQRNCRYQTIRKVMRLDPVSQQASMDSLVNSIASTTISESDSCSSSQVKIEKVKSEQEMSE